MGVEYVCNECGSALVGKVIQEDRFNIQPDGSLEAEGGEDSVTIQCLGEEAHEMPEGDPRNEDLVDRLLYDVDHKGG